MHNFAPSRSCHAAVSFPGPTRPPNAPCAHRPVTTTDLTYAFRHVLSRCVTCNTSSPGQAPAGPRPSCLAAKPTSRTSSCPRIANGDGSCRRASAVPRAAAAQDGPPDSANTPSGSQDSAKQQPAYTLEDTRILVETAMLSAVSGLAYLISTILKLENSLGYFLPLPVVLAALRGGPGGGAGWRTMMATCFLLVVLLGPLRALSYFFLHGLLAGTLGSMWRGKANFWLGIAVGAVVRMAGQLSYLVLSSVAMNENMFALLLSNVYNMLDQVSAAIGLSGSPSPLAVSCMVFSLLLVNGLTYCFLVHVVYRVVLTSMGYSLGPLPGLVSKYLNAGLVEQGKQLGGSGSS